PFDAAQAVENLRCERYHAPVTNLPTVGSAGLFRRGYYFMRPLLGGSTRKYLQRFFFRHWQDIPFPPWPLHCTVDDLLERFLCLSMKATGTSRVPFIWFWPEGMPSCAMITHDVETAAGVKFCSALMDLNDSFGIKSSLQIVPEERYEVTASF